MRGRGKERLQVGRAEDEKSRQGERKEERKGKRTWRGEKVR